MMGREGEVVCLHWASWRIQGPCRLEKVSGIAGNGPCFAILNWFYKLVVALVMP